MNKVKHLEMIQSIIERMQKNSFIIKGWLLTIVVAMFTIASQINKCLIFTIFIPIVFFYGLDVYYLQLERKYRVLYDSVRYKINEEVDFNLDIKDIQCPKKCKYYKCCLSCAILLFYTPLIVVCIISVCTIWFLGWSI